jgi:hypothetical protein
VVPVDLAGRESTDGHALGWQGGTAGNKGMPFRVAGGNNHCTNFHLAGLGNAGG